MGLPLSCASEHVACRTSTSNMIEGKMKLHRCSDGGQGSLRCAIRSGYVIPKDVYLSRNRARVCRGVTMIRRDMS